MTPDTSTASPHPDASREPSGTKFTPGPWHRYAEHLRGGRFFVVTRPSIASTDEEVRDSIDIHEDDNGEADTALIAGAPDLYAALQGMVALWEALIEDGTPADHLSPDRFARALDQLVVAREALARTFPSPGPAGADGAAAGGGAE